MFSAYDRKPKDARDEVDRRILAYIEGRALPVGLDAISGAFAYDNQVIRGSVRRLVKGGSIKFTTRWDGRAEISGYLAS